MKNCGSTLERGINQTFGRQSYVVSSDCNQVDTHLQCFKSQRPHSKNFKNRSLQISLLRGDPKTKFLLLFLSAVHHPPFHPTKKNSPDFAPLHPTSAVRPGANPIQWGQSYTMYIVQDWPHCIGLAPGQTSDVERRTGAMSGEVFYGQSVFLSEGSRTAEGIVRRRTADRRKFLLCFRTSPFEYFMG